MTQKSTSTRLLSTNGTGSVQRSAVSGGSGETISCGLNCFRRIFALFILVAFISIIVFSLNRYVVVAVVGKSHKLIWPLFHYPLVALHQGVIGDPVSPWLHSLHLLANSFNIDYYCYEW